MLSMNSTDLEHAYLTDHGLRVDLAHVVTRVVPLNVRDMQLPGVVSVVANRHPIHFVIFKWITAFPFETDSYSFFLYIYKLIFLHTEDVQLPGVVSVVANLHLIYLDIDCPYPKVLILYIKNFIS